MTVKKKTLVSEADLKKIECFNASNSCLTVLQIPVEKEGY
jgi:hypothetical protein